MPYMAKRNNRSGIINLSSFSALNAIPSKEPYCGTKAYNDLHSRAATVYAEFKYPGKFDIMSLRPLKVTAG
jgi:NADP-dependent 3-hydroxy acid dehydrogenase YdfG